MVRCGTPSPFFFFGSHEMLPNIHCPVLFQELIEKLNKGELPKDEYPCMNDPSPTFHGTSQSLPVRTTHSQPAYSMRSRRPATWARPRNSDDGYSRYIDNHSSSQNASTSKWSCKNLISCYQIAVLLFSFVLLKYLINLELSSFRHRLISFANHWAFCSDSVLRHASSDFKRMGQRIFIFIVGGTTRSEVPCCLWLIEHNF